MSVSQSCRSAFIVFVLVPILPLCPLSGCLFAGGGRDEGPDLTAFRAALTEYHPVVEGVVSDVARIGETTQILDQALVEDDEVKTDAAIDEQAAAVDRLLVRIAQLEGIERRLQGEPASGPGMITQGIFIIGAGLVILGTYGFARKMKSLSDEMTAARRQRDDAADRIMVGDDKAEADYTKAKQKMAETGAEAITEVTVKVSTDLILSPINPVSAGGMVIKEIAGNALGDGIKVITATESCRTDPAGSGCKIAVQRPDEKGRVTLPAGKQDVVISAPGKARIAISEVAVSEGVDTEIERALIPVDQATPDNVDANDAGRPVEPLPKPTSDAGVVAPDARTPDTGAGSDVGVVPGDLGPRCTLLAACCPKVDEPLYVLQQCEKAVAGKDETNCSILLTNIKRIYGCED